MRSKAIKMLIILGAVFSLCNFQCFNVDTDRDNLFDPQSSGYSTYTVVYSGNGNSSGDVPVDEEEYMKGDTVTVRDNTGNLQKTGYSFIGWNTEQDGTGITYTSGQFFVIGSVDVMLYAKWSENPTYTVTYNGNGNTGGSVPVDNTNYETGQTVTVPGNPGNLVKSGYTFVGWNTAEDGMGTNYGQGSTFNMGSSNVILYAKWIVTIKYSVSYHGNNNTGGFVPIDDLLYEQGESVTVLGNINNLIKINFSGVSYCFKGWNTKADGSGITYTQGQTFYMGSSNVVLYANWVPYTLRDVGPAGGWIIYDKGYYSDGWRYMEAAPYSIDSDPWGEEGNYIGGTDTNFGAGRNNTDLIIDGLEGWSLRGLCAAWHCKYFSYGSYNDWFLPSSYELNLIYSELYIFGIGGYYGAFWSSSEFGSDNAYYLSLSSGGILYSNKHHYFDVIPVREF